MTDEEREALVKNAAMAAIQRRGADPGLLDALCEQLTPYYDERGNLGHGAKAHVVRGSAHPSITPEQALDRLLANPGNLPTPNVSPGFVASSAEAYDAETERLVQERMVEMAPDGNVLRLAPSRQVQIAADVQQEREAARPGGPRPFVDPRKARKEAGPDGRAVNYDGVPRTAYSPSPATAYAGSPEQYDPDKERLADRERTRRVQEQDRAATAPAGPAPGYEDHVARLKEVRGRHAGLTPPKR